MMVEPYEHDNFKEFGIPKKEVLEIKDNIQDIASTLMKEGSKDIKSDVDGSYTGTSFDGEIPIQDADDL